MDQEILNKFEEQNKKLNDIYRSVEKTRKYFLWTLISGLVLFLLPLLGLLIVIPKFINAINPANFGF